MTTSKVTQVDWERWIPTERAVLCFIRDGSRLMLIEKKTGLGAGKVNAPGGRIEKGESALQAAIRETIEEIGLTPIDPRAVGELSFIFTDGYSLHGTIFFADRYTGTPCETTEATPFWCEVAALPYDRMWEDDRHWLPLVLAGAKIEGFFIFDGDVMVDHEIRLEKEPHG